MAIILILFTRTASAQLLPVDTLKTDSLKNGMVKPAQFEAANSYDVGDLIKKILHKKPGTKQPSGITVIPNIASNPTIGFQVGIKAVAGRKLGTDPNTSVLNRWNQTHEVPNLFITDGAAMASSGCQNPSLTYMALSARAADHAVQLMGAGAL